MYLFIVHYYVLILISSWSDYSVLYDEDHDEVKDSLMASYQHLSEFNPMQ